MKILIVAATSGEISPLQQKLNGLSNHEVRFCLTGAGSVATTYFLTKHLQNYGPDLCINTGIAGAFDRSIQIGDVVNITEDYFGDLGAEDGQKFLSMDELGLGTNKVNDVILYDSTLLSGLKKVKSITVNKVHGAEESIERAKNFFNPQVESMEGAAAMFVCAQEKIPFVQIRSISNYVEKRNRNAWQIPLAVKNLNDFLIEFIAELK